MEFIEHSSCNPKFPQLETKRNQSKNPELSNLISHLSKFARLRLKSELKGQVASKFDLGLLNPIPTRQG